MKKVKSILPLTFVIILAGLFAAFIISGLAGGQKEAGVFLNDFATRPIKASDEYVSVLDAETVSQSKQLDIPFDLGKKLAEKKFEKKFKEEFLSSMSISAQLEGLQIYGENGCYLSVYGVPEFSVEKVWTVNSVQCFIFTKDLEVAGVVYFYENDKKTICSSITSFNSDSDLIRKLSANKSKRYIVLTNGLETKLLDSENKITKIGAVRKDLEVIGDCYSILEQHGLSLSYDDIINEENLIWFDFEE